MGAGSLREKGAVPVLGVWGKGSFQLLHFKVVFRLFGYHNVAQFSAFEIFAVKANVVFYCVQKNCLLSLVLLLV